MECSGIGFSEKRNQFKLNKRSILSMILFGQPKENVKTFEAKFKGKQYKLISLS